MNEIVQLLVQGIALGSIYSLIALGIVVVAVLIETTVFEQIQPFGYAPALGMLAVIAAAYLSFS